MAKKKKDKEAKSLDKAINAASKAKGVSDKEEKFLKDLVAAAKKDGNVTKKELKAIKKEIKLQKNDKNASVAKYKTQGTNSAGTGATAYLAYRTGKSTKPVIQPTSTSGGSGGTVAAPTPTNGLSLRNQPSQVKTPSQDIINLSDAKYEDAASIFNQFVRDFGGIELSILSNHKTITGQNTMFNPIKNLQSLWKEYSPMDDSENIKGNQKFSINLFDFIPKSDNIGEVQENVTIDNSGVITIELLDVPNNLVVDVQASPGPSITNIDEA